MKGINLPGLDESSNIDKIYHDFIIEPLCEMRVKNNTPDWFDGKIMDEIKTRDKLHRKFINTKLEVDGLPYRSSRNKVQNLINSKKKIYIQNSLEQNKRDSKKLRKTLKNLGLPSKTKSDSKIILTIDGQINSKPAEIADHFSDFYSTLADKLVEKLLNAPNKF